MRRRRRRRSAARLAEVDGIDADALAARVEGASVHRQLDRARRRARPRTLAPIPARAAGARDQPRGRSATSPIGTASRCSAPWSRRSTTAPSRRPPTSRRCADRPRRRRARRSSPRPRSRPIWPRRLADEVGERGPDRRAVHREPRRARLGRRDVRGDDAHQRPADRRRRCREPDRVLHRRVRLGPHPAGAARRAARRSDDVADRHVGRGPRPGLPRRRAGPRRAAGHRAGRDLGVRPLRSARCVSAARDGRRRQPRAPHDPAVRRHRRSGCCSSACWRSA